MNLTEHNALFKDLITQIFSNHINNNSNHINNNREKISDK